MFLYTLRVMKTVPFKVVGWGEDNGVMAETMPGEPGKLLRVIPAPPKFYLVLELPGGTQTRAYVSAGFYKAYHELIGQPTRG